jgi:hypothetical protein
MQSSPHQEREAPRPETLLTAVRVVTESSQDAA